MISSDWDKRNCPVCNIDLISKFPEVESLNRAEFMNFESVKEYFIGIRKNQIFFSYFKCLNCGILYCPWYFNKDQLDLLYKEMPNNLMGEDKSTASKTQKGYMRWLLKNEIRVENYLEIGPDVGLVSNQIDKIFNVKNAILVEPNLAVRTQLIESMPNSSNIEVIKDLNALRPFDANLVVGVHVFDHLLRPLQDLKLIHKVSNKDCIILAVVHNEKSLLRRLLKKKFPPFCLQHPQLYNPQTMKKILDESGWDLICHKKTINWFSLRNIFGLVFSIFGITLKIDKGIPKIEIPLILGNQIFVAKKREKECL